MAAGDLTTRDDVKAWAIINSSTEDALLDRLVTACSQAMQTYMGRTIASQDYTETRDGSGGVKLAFANRPVTAVSSVMINGVSISPAASFGATGYSFSKTAIWLSGYSFSRGNGNVVLAYTAGFATVPVDLAQACIEQVAMRYSERKRIGQKSKIIDKETITFDVKAMPDDVKLILDNYKKVVIL